MLGKGGQNTSHSFNSNVCWATVIIIAIGLYMRYSGTITISAKELIVSACPKRCDICVWNEEAEKAECKVCAARNALFANEAGTCDGKKYCRCLYHALDMTNCLNKCSIQLLLSHQD